MQPPPTTYLCAVRPPHARISSSSVSLQDIDRTRHPQHQLPLTAIVPPHCCILGTGHVPLAQAHLLAEERSSFSSSLLSEPEGSFVDSSPHAVSVADCRGERQRGCEKRGQGKGGPGGPQQ